MNSRFFRRGALLALGLVGAMLIQPASAQRHGGGHGGAGLWGLGLGLGLGWEIANVGGYYPYGYYGYRTYPVYPAYAYPYPYPYAYPYAPAPAPYPAAPAPQYQPQAANWYYCDSAKAYYPYVAQCAEGWRAVPSVPPGVAR